MTVEWHFEELARFSHLIEGPAWDGNGLLFSECDASLIHRYDPATGQCQVWLRDTGEANGLMFDRAGHLYACEGGHRRIVRYEPARTVTVVDSFAGKRLNSPNDLAIDDAGRIWFTDPRYTDDRETMELDHESVYRADPHWDGSWTLQRMTFDTTRPNGLLISPDQRTLYVAQSEYGEGNPRELRAYPILADGTLGQYEVLHTFYPHRGIDGMCLDVDGNIVATAGWQQSGPGPMIYVFAPDGRVLETHPVPVNQPTNCTWGDADLRTLYVTTGAGVLFRVRTNRQGRLLFPPPRA